MTYRVSIRHNFETAHRLSHPNAPHKCQSIHGHSWWATIWIEGDALDEMGMLVEFGAFKKAWRGFLDDELDHHLVVKQGDPVIDALLSILPDTRLRILPFDPTTEHMAQWIHMRSVEILASIAPKEMDLRISKVHIQETMVNAAEFEPGR